MTDITALADISRKTFYHYYAGVCEVVAEIKDSITASLDDADRSRLSAALRAPPFTSSMPAAKPRTPSPFPLRSGR